MSTGPYASSGSPHSDGEGGDGLTGAAGQAQQKAQDLAGQAQQQAQGLAGQAQQQAQDAAGRAKSRLREQLDERSSRTAEQINQQAADLRSVSSSLREQDKEGPAGAADRLAEYAEKVGGYLNDRDSDRLLADLEDFGRRQPWAIAAGGLALGFAASRFLKASSSRRYSERYSDPAGSRPGQSTGYAAPRPPQTTSYTRPATGSGPDLAGPPIADWNRSDYPLDDPLATQSPVRERATAADPPTPPASPAPPAPGV